MNENRNSAGPPVRAWLAALCLIATGCSSGAVGEAVRPEALSGSEAMEAAPMPGCGDEPRFMEPLAVDWPSDKRVDLEVAMKDGVAVIRYDCKGMQVLPDCRLEGSYAFAGVSLKEDVIRIENSDELRANLPLSFATLEGELTGSATIDLAVALVGRRGTVRKTAARTELRGSCDGATHFVRNAMVGAFAMDRGELGRVRAAAEILGVGGGAKSESKKMKKNRDGQLSSCKQSSPDADAPPAQCGSVIRLRLQPVVAERDAEQDKAAAKNEPDDPDPCPEGWAMREGKCAEVEKGPICGKSDPKEPGVLDACDKACKAGDTESCFVLASHLPKEEAKRRTELLEQSCDRGHGRACSRLAFGLMISDKSRGLELFERACALGEAYTCWNVGQWFLNGRGAPKDETKGALMVNRACALGSPHGCASMGSLYIDGVGVKQDVDKGLGYYRKLCDNGHAGYCHKLGSIYASDRGAKRDPRLPAPKGVKRDVAKGVATWERACSLKYVWSCTLAGQHYAKGDGVAKDEKRARELFESACPASSYNWDGCAALGKMTEEGMGGPKDVAKAVDYYERSCPFGEGCIRAAEMLTKGQGVAADPARAKAIYAKLCKQKGQFCDEAK